MKGNYFHIFNSRNKMDLHLKNKKKTIAFISSKWENALLYSYLTKVNKHDF